ncbi:MAG: glycosyltransferase family 2 protein [Thermoanaerobaculia bacterium]|nr:glycosyltransferase family 2 protein [Thermoanaerobaculia bacterium]
MVALPALNESYTIRDVIGNIPRDIPGIRRVDVLVVDDGSTDETGALALEAGAHVVRHRSTRGVGAAFHTILGYGIEHGADLIVTIDSDGQFDPRDIPALIAPVSTGEAEFSTASRFKDPDLVPEMSLVKKWGNRMMSRLISSLANEKFYDVSCGMRCYSRKAALQLHLIGHFTYTQEVFLNLAFKGMRMVEVPIRVRGRREFGKSRVASNLFRYAIRTSQIILRCYRDYFPLRFFGRISILFALIGAVLGTFFLSNFLRTGRFSPHLWAGFVSGALFAFSLMMFHIGVIGDMMTRHRIYLEEMLYHQRSMKHRFR